MDDLLFWLAAVNLVICAVITFQLIVAASALRNLTTVEPLEGDELPRVSIVVAARNEARHMAAALRSLLGLDYPGLEIVVVNDRSTDETGAVLDQIAEEQRAAVETQVADVKSPGATLRIVHLSELPPGWLGKNHALFRGAKESSGEYILFTDADIVMERTVLRRAVAYAQQQQLEHVAMLFRIVMPTWLLEAFVVTFSIYFLAHVRPWKVRDPNSKAHIGVGGFNLLRREAYLKIGTHQAIAMRPDDDLKLGKLVKLHGLKQDVLLGPDLVHVPWYSSVREMLVGLEKNAFAGVDYNIPVVVLSSLTIFLLNAFPFLAVFVTTGGTQVLYAAVVVSLLLISLHTARECRLRLSAAFGFPLAVLMFIFVLWRTMLLNLLEGGIRWRDTFYPLAELKANKV